jgi:NAD(P)-dependent dehydrogenase (short-subunit alcohol dehydrogenase family)
MDRVVLISDVQTPLGEELARRYLAAGASVAVTRSNQEARESPLVSESDGLLLTDWNRRSAISTRNVLLSALNRFGRIDEALLLHCPAIEASLLGEASYEAIERAVDTWLKGTLFLAKGLLEAFARAGGGRLALVHHARQGDSSLLRQSGAGLPPLESTLRGAFRALAQSLLDTGGADGVAVHGFESFATPERDFAAFIVQAMTERGPSGKWLRFQPRGGLLGPLLGRKA